MMTPPGEPMLNPAPGRCIVRMVPRFTHFPGPGGLELDSRYQYQPMVGSLAAIGVPRNEAEAQQAKWAKIEAEAGRLFIFSAWGSGSEMYTNEMAGMERYGYDFAWLRGYRLFDIGQLGMTVSGSGAYGEKPLPSVEDGLPTPRLLAETEN